MKRTNTKAYKATVRAYLADCILDNDGNAFADHRAAFQHARNRFESEYNYDANKRRYPNTQQRVAEWLYSLRGIHMIPPWNKGDQGHLTLYKRIPVAYLWKGKRPE